MTIRRTSANRWLICTHPRPQPLLRLLLVPSAGTGAGLYHGWARAMPSWLETWGVTAPGRDHRLSEPVPRLIREHVFGIAEALRELDDVPLVVFGHSMGSAIGFELVRYLRDGGQPLPVRLFVSSLRAPRLPTDHDPEHELPDGELVARVRMRYGGFPPEVEEFPEVLELALEVLRQDLRAVETHAWLSGPPLPTPITALGGDADPSVPVGDLLPWAEETIAGFTWHVFPGDHRYLDTRRHDVLAFLRQELRALGAGTQGPRQANLDSSQAHSIRER